MRPVLTCLSSGLLSAWLYFGLHDSLGFWSHCLYASFMLLSPRKVSLSNACDVNGMAGCLATNPFGLNFDPASVAKSRVSFSLDATAGTGLIGSAGLADHLWKSALVVEVPWNGSLDTCIV